MVERKSQFTYRHLKLLSQFCPTTPLRVIALVDYDAFYAQCEIVRLRLPETQPLAVRQWKAVIALNYPARAFGIKRGASVDDVKRLCPNIVLQHVATWREGESTWSYREDATDQEALKFDKAALDPYRIQSRKSLELIKATLLPISSQRIEKASVDEVFLDLSAQVYSILVSRYAELATLHKDLDERLPFPSSETTLNWESDHVIDPDSNDGNGDVVDWDDLALHIGAEIIRNLRQVIYERMKYTCSAGIAHNKAIAKLAAGHKKPNQQTIVRARAVPSFLSTLKVTSIRGLGGELGAQAAEAFGADKISDLLPLSMSRMKSDLGAGAGTWLYNVIRGVENSEVIARTDLQSMLAQKTFAPPMQNATQASRWFRIFAADLMGRINDLDVESEQCRRPTVIALHHHIRGRFGPTRSKQTTIPSGATVTEQLLYTMSLELLQHLAADSQPMWPCVAIGMSVHKFAASITQNRQITSFFGAQSSADPRKRKREGSPIEKNRRFPYVPSIYSNLEEEKNGSAAQSFSSNPDECPTATILTADTENLIVNSYACPRCSEIIDGASVLEHLDWHVALELQEQTGG